MPTVHIYSRQGCHLCEILIEELLPLVCGVLDIEVHDIDTRPDWREKYDVRVPVVEFDDRLICQYQLDRDAIAAVVQSVSRAARE